MLELCWVMAGGWECYLVVEENMVVEVFISVAPHQLEGELTELPEVVSRHSARVGFIESQRLRGNLTVSRGVFALQFEHVLLYLRVAEWLLDAASIRP